MKATKEIFDRANELYSEIMTHGDSEGMVDAYNALIEEYDFDNEIFTDENGKRGIRWCWGGTMVAPQYDAVKHYNIFGVPTEDFRAIVARDGKDYLINGRGDILFEADELRPAFGTITPATFRHGDKWGIVGSVGRDILPARYDEIWFDLNEFIVLKLGGKVGFIAGGHLVEPKFDSIEFDMDEKLIATLDGKTGYVDENDEIADDNVPYYNLSMFI